MHIKKVSFFHQLYYIKTHQSFKYGEVMFKFFNIFINYQSLLISIIHFNYSYNTLNKFLFSDYEKIDVIKLIYEIYFYNNNR